MSMNPGATACPVASITRVASPARCRPMAPIRSPSTATSAGRAVALRAAALHHEVRHDPMEREPVVEALLRERDEVLDGLRRVRRVEFHPDLAALLERDDACLLHRSLLS